MLGEEVGAVMVEVGAGEGEAAVDIAEETEGAELTGFRHLCLPLTRDMDGRGHRHALSSVVPDGSSGANHHLPLRWQLGCQPSSTAQWQLGCQPYQ